MSNPHEVMRGPVTTPTEGEGGLYAAPNSTFDTPPPYDWGYRPGGAHADGGPVEMEKGGSKLIKQAAGYLRSSRLGDMEREIAAKHGASQGRRFEQAADSADLERFSDDALRKTFDRSDTGLYTTMPPGDFEKFADPIPPSVLDKVPYYKLGYRDLAGSLPESQQSYDAFIRILQGLSERGGLSSVPELRISDREGPYKSIRSHEGRHRMRMLDRAGEQDALVHLIPDNYGLFDGRVDRLMGRYFPYGNNTPFMPEASHMSPGDESRPMIQFPRPVFEEGGPVEMAGGGFFKRLARSVAGKPDTVKLPDVGNVPAQPLAELEDISQRFATRHGNQYPIESYSPLDEERARRIAQEYDSMQHNPFDPATKRSYEALVDETMDQYRALKDTGVDFSFLKPGEADPYARNPGLGYLDLIENGRLKMFPTSDGFGTLNETSNNPLLKRVGRVGDLEDATANDAFRIVHDMLGHYGPGNPFFRSKGEERAWQAHGRAYSPDALPAATSELRGQNSWVNYGPHGESNRTASGADTIYADQKTGIMPPWTWLEKADGGPVEMATGGTTPTSTGGQYDPPKSEGPGFFRNQDNYDNSSAGGINFVKKFVQSLSPAEQEAQRLVSEATRRTGKEAVIFGRGDDPADLSGLTQGNYDSVKVPDYYHRFASQSLDPFFSLHSHPTSTLSPSTADLKLWGNTYPATLGLPYQSMLINASPQDSLLRLGVPGKFMDSLAARRVREVLNDKREADDVVAFSGYSHPRIQEFMRGNKLPDAAHLLHAEAQPMPGVTKYLNSKHPGVAQDVTVRDLYAGDFLQRITDLGIPVDVSAEHRIAGTPYLAQDVWPEFAAHVKKYNLKADGGPVEMEKGGPLRKAAAAVKRLASDPAWDSAKANAAQYEIAGMGKGAGPLDLSDLDQRIPGILQEAIPRVDPPRGVSPRLQDALANPKVLSSIEDSIRHGQTLGADKWYHNNPLYQAFVRELGPEQGHADFMKYMDYQSAASPRSDVPTNIRNASYYFTNEGKDPRSWAEMPVNPAPYGHIAQGLHRSNADVVRMNEGDWGGYDVFKNPKPPSYGTNLGGNLLPVALDSHAFKNIGMRTEDPRFLMTSLSDFLKVDPFSDVKLAEADDIGGRLSFAQQYGTPGAMKDGKYRVDYKPQQLVASGRLSMDEALSRPVLWDAKPRDNEYAAGEKMYQQMGSDMGIDPADAQSAAWAGAGKLTGLGTPPDKTFGQMHNERVLLTAKLRGEDPADTLRKLIRREAPLFAEGGTVEDQYHPIWQQSFAGGGQPEMPDKYDNAFDAMYPWLSMDASSLTPEPDRSYDSEPSGINTIEGNLVDSLYGGRITPTAEERYDRRKSREAYRAEHPEGVYSTDPLRGILGMIGKQRAGWSADQAEMYGDESEPGQRAIDQIGHLGRTFAHDVTGGLSDKLIAALSPGAYSANVPREAAATRSAREQLDPYVRAPMSVLPYMLSPAQQLAQYGMTVVSNLAEPAHGAVDWARKQFDKSMLGLARPVSEAVYGEMKPSFTRPQWDKGYGFDHGGPVGYAGGGHAKDTGNTFDFLGPFGAGLNIIADGAGAIFGGEDFELDKALGYLGEIGGSLAMPGVGGSLGRGAGTMAAHLIEPGEGDVGRDALNAGYGALRGGAGMFFAGGGPVGFSPQGREKEDPNDLTRFLSPQVNPSVQPDPMDWAASGGVPGAISPPINANNGQMARDAAERERLMAQAQASSMKGLQSQSASGGGGGGSGIGGMLKTLAPFANFIPGIGPMVSMGMQAAGSMMAAEGGPVPAPDGKQPWMYGDGALMARGGYLRGCGGMNG